MHSIKRLMVASVIAASVNACQILPDNDSGYRDARLGQYSARQSNEYIARFNALQMEIDQLKTQLSDSKQSHKNQRDLLIERRQRKEKIEEIKTMVDQKVADVKGEIDLLIAGLTSSSEVDQLVAIQNTGDLDAFNTALPPGAGEASQQATVQVASLGGIEPNRSVDKVQHKEVLSPEIQNNSETEQAQRYDVVYVFDNEPPQESMWSTLNSFDINDKWRGINSEKQSYFIYVGVYNSLAYAQDRKLSLQGLTGQAPQIKNQSGQTQVTYNNQP